MELTIPQEIALLAYSVKCWRHRTPNLSLYLVAAAMTQLLIERRAYLTADKRVVVPSDATATSPDLNLVMGTLRAHQGHRQLRKWIQWFHNRHEIKSRFHQTVLDTLVKNDAMTVAYMKRMLGTRRVMTPSLLEVERLVQRVRAELLEDGPVERRTAALILLLARTRYLRDLFSKYESDRLRTRIDLRNSHPEMAEVSETVKSVMDEMAAVAGVTAAVMGGTSG